MLPIFGYVINNVPQFTPLSKSASGPTFEYEPKTAELESLKKNPLQSYQCNHFDLIHVIFVSATAGSNIKTITYHTKVNYGCHLQVETKRLSCIKGVFNGLLGPTVMVLNVCVLVMYTCHNSSSFKVGWGKVLCC